MKLITRRLIGLSAAVILQLMTACQPSNMLGFPKAEIVFQSSRWQEPSIGFANSDGSNRTIIELKDYYPNRPMWSFEKDSIVFIQPYDPAGASGSVNTFGGRISILSKDGRIHQCKNKFLWNVSSITPLNGLDERNEAIIVNAAWQIILFDIQTCRELHLYVDYVDDQDQRIRGASPSSNGNYIVFSEVLAARSPSPNYMIRIMDTQTGETWSIAKGINPSWSPDGTKIAFTGLDGIYVVEVESGESIRLVDYSKSTDNTYGKDFNFNVPPPAPRWSPDGRWLIYHKCNPLSFCQQIEDYSIFKVNLETGTESKVVEGGIFPDWGTY